MVEGKESSNQRNVDEDVLLIFTTLVVAGGRLGAFSVFSIGDHQWRFN